MTEITEWKAGQSVKLLPRIVDNFKSTIIVTERTLVVRGLKPYANLDIQLSPYTYVDTPEYWEIEVIAVGPLGGILLPAVTPFETEPLDLNRVLGNVGIEVIWEDEREQLETPRKLVLQFQGGRSDTLALLSGVYQITEKFRYPCPKLLDPFKTCPAELNISFTHPRIDEVIGAVRDCASGAGLAALVVAAIAFITLGEGLTPAIAAFKTVFETCLEAKSVEFARDIVVSVNVEKL